MTIQGHIRVPPNLFQLELKESVKKTLDGMYEGFISKEMGIVVAVTDVTEIGDGLLIPEDGAAYYETKYKLITYKPDMFEIVPGKVTDIQEFGAFMEIGPIDGMIHVSQTMDDYVSFSKSNVLTGKESKRVLKVGDKCRARIVAVSFKDPSNPKIALTMRQQMLGAEHWIDEEIKKKAEKN